MRNRIIKITVFLCIFLAILITGKSYVFSANVEVQQMKATISGNVWEDLNLHPNSYGVLKGNAIYDEGIDKQIAGMKVKLYELDINEQSEDGEPIRSFD